MMEHSSPNALKGEKLTNKQEDIVAQLQYQTYKEGLQQMEKKP